MKVDTHKSVGVYFFTVNKGKGVYGQAILKTGKQRIEVSFLYANQRLRQQSATQKKAMKK